MNDFFAYVNRLKYIERWGLMRRTESENLWEHSFQTAVLAHCLAFIAKNELGKKADVTVATSDYMEQLMIFGSGAKRITSAELKADIENAKEKIRSSINRTGNDKNYVLAELLKEVNDKEAD